LVGYQRSPQVAPVPSRDSTLPICSDVRPDLPRTATGKIQRFKLRQLEG